MVVNKAGGAGGTGLALICRGFAQGVSAKIDLSGALAIVQDVRGVKDMIDVKMVDRGHERRNVKLGIGGIREIEFYAQTHQLIHGGRNPGLRLRGTRATLDALAAAGVSVTSAAGTTHGSGATVVARCV